MGTPLSRKLQRELKTNPKKAGILAVLAVVALYFWAPLFSGWFGKGSAATQSPVAPATSTRTVEIRPPAATEKPAVNWQQLAAWIERDPRMQPETNLVLARDPFEFPAAVPEVFSEPVAATRQEKIEITPQSAGLSLSSTIVGPRQRMALLGGKTYRLGDTIVSRKDDDLAEFVLTEVHSRKIVLWRDGKNYELKLNPIKLANAAASATGIAQEAQSDTDELDSEPTEN